MASNLDYNLLQTFVLLYKHRNLKLVGRALGVTESAVSKHLSKLREQLDDPLFVRDSQGFEPTSFTEEIIPTLIDGLNTIQTALAKNTIDCANYEGDITIAIIPVMHIQFGAQLLLELKTTFPKAMISLLTYDNHTTQDIANGSIDMGVNYFNPMLSKSIYQKRIKMLKHGVILPARLADLTDDQILDLPFVAMAARGRHDIKIFLQEISVQAGHELNTYAYVDNLICMLNTIEEIDGFSIVQLFDVSDERFCFRVLPEIYQEADNYSLVSVMKASNKSNPLHMLLSDILKKKIEQFSVS
ncbi:LysR family transcriptional regulator [Vibrio ziniensis]|uniref:LysR family transcriptional regulator n=1 Tax=Vibrio ziniensis TaxID=2711221 RepID=A0A6G7CQG7_9VIBR|nr:LysR family transcriptional regulator [Vibrio ziniensis]QIH44355.1 LysR family transcriptional regulator [Vibrio ziniensis]